MEVDPDTGLNEFKDLIKTALGPSKASGGGERGGERGSGGGGGGMMGNIGLPDLKGEIGEMLSGKHYK